MQPGAQSMWDLASRGRSGSTALGGDPDIHLMRWLAEGGAPGLPPPHRDVRRLPGGPALGGPQEAEAFWAKCADGADYKSLEEEAEWVIPTLEAMVQKGQLTPFASLEEARATHGDIIVNKAS